MRAMQLYLAYFLWFLATLLFQAGTYSHLHVDLPKDPRLSIRP